MKRDWAYDARGASRQEMVFARVLLISSRLARILFDPPVSESHSGKKKRVVDLSSGSRGDEVPTGDVNDATQRRLIGYSTWISGKAKLHVAQSTQIDTRSKGRARTQGRVTTRGVNWRTTGAIVPH